MIYSRDDVKRMLQTIRELPRFDADPGGCGCDQCEVPCYVSITNGTDFVKSEDLDEALEKIERTI